MAIDPVLLMSASAQARLIADGHIGASDLLKRQMDAISDSNASLNAFVTVIPSDPSPHGVIHATPLSGICFAVKDNIDVQGIASHCGLRALHARPQERDAPVVSRLKSAGLVCVGKLNMHAVALGATNQNVDFGNCYNPRLTTHTPGGSSGGSGAAVAAGLCGIALGTDTMGSVRIPAAYCGVVGFKPSFEAVPMQGVMPLCRALDHVGILARTVEDVVHAFRIIGDFPQSEAATVPCPPESDLGRLFQLAVPSSPEKLRMNAEVSAAFNAALDRLKARGFSLHPLDLDSYPFTRLRRAGLLLSEAELLNTLAEPLARYRSEMPSDLLAMLDFASRKTAAELARALSEVVAAGQWLHRALLPFEALLLPTTGQTSFPMEGEIPSDQADFTAMANMSGGPALSLPVPVAADKLPVGLQLVGRRGNDWSLLDAAQRIESALR